MAEADPRGAIGHRRARGDDCLAALTQPPAELAGWGTARWSRLLRQARAAGLLLRIADGFTATGAAPAPWPDAFGAHVESARRVMQAQRLEVAVEMARIHDALRGLGVPLVLLKGAAYLAAGLPSGNGRLFSDIDILVPKSALAGAEAALMLHGWMGTHHDAYDQRYYREWMHELPPMQHVRRRTTLDVHHNILPETARLRPDASRLIAASVPLPDHPGWRVLAPADMVLHSMTHLFMNEEMSHALRDLSDLDLLMRHHAGVDSGFWSVLLARANELDLARPLFYGLRYCAALLGTPVPATVLEQTQRHGPTSVIARLMDWLWLRALRSPDATAALPGRPLALWALYVRGHWLRMPPALLLRHLTIKSLRRPHTGGSTEGANAP